MRTVTRIGLLLSSGLFAASLCAATTAMADPVWPDDYDCTTCHTRQVDAAADEDCLITKHAMLDCTICHEDSETLAKMHSDVEEGQRIPKSLKQTVVPNEVCLVCHTYVVEPDGASTDEEATEEKDDATEEKDDATEEATANDVEDSATDAEAAESEDENESATVATGIPQIPTGVTISDDNDLAVDVHNLPVNDDHTLSVTCGSCHAMHNSKTPEKLAQATCTTCHHKNVFECHTCH